MFSGLSNNFLPPYSDLLRTPNSMNSQHQLHYGEQGMVDVPHALSSQVSAHFSEMSDVNNANNAMPTFLAPNNLSMLAPNALHIPPHVHSQTHSQTTKSD